MSNTNYKVSIRLMTYNHAPFIRDAMEGIFSQKANFNIQIVVGDDFSDDNTLNIIESFTDTANIHIKILDRKIGDVYWAERQKYGRLYNFTNILENCDGEYIALLDGDDYWIDPYKLSKQVEVLDKQNDVVACHHWHIYGRYKQGKFYLDEAPKNNQGYLAQHISSVEDVFANRIRLKSRTVLFRNIINAEFFPKKFYSLAFGDVPLSFLLGEYGKFYFIDEVMAVYRQTNQGISRKGRNKFSHSEWVENHYKQWIEVWDFGNHLYKGKFQNHVATTVAYFYKFIEIKHTSKLIRMKLVLHNLLIRNCSFSLKYRTLLEYFK